MHLSGTVIISGGNLASVSVFKDIELIRLQLQPSIRRMTLFLLQKSS